MTEVTILQEAIYDQMISEFSSICELSCESYISQIYTEDASLKLILESGEKTIDTLITFVKKTIEAAIEHIQTTIQTIRIKFTKKRLEQMMSPEMKKVLTSLCDGKKIESPNILKLMKEIEKYKTIISHMNKEVSSLFDKAYRESSIEKEKSYYEKAVKICEKYADEVKEITEEINRIRTQKKTLTVQDVYRFTDVGIKSLDIGDFMIKEIRECQSTMIKTLSNAKMRAGRTKQKIEEIKLSNKLKDVKSSTYQKVQSVSTQIADSPVMRDAVNKAVSLTNDVSIGVVRAEQYLLGFMESWYRYGMQSDITYGIANAGAKIGIAKYLTGGNPLVGVAATGVMTAGNAAMKAYTVKNLHRDKMKLKEKADELQHKNDLRKSNSDSAEEVKKQNQTPDLKLR